MLCCRWCCYKSQRRIFHWLLALVAVSLLSLLQLLTYHHHRQSPGSSGEDSTSFVFVIKKQQPAAATACQLPSLKLWDQSIIDLLNNSRTENRQCASDYPLIKLVWSALNPTERSKLQLTSRGQREIPSRLRCFYQLVSRKIDDDKFIIYGPETKIVSFPIEMPGEVVFVVCRDKSSSSSSPGRVIYTDTFASINPPKNKVVTANINQNKNQKWNVMVIGIDSASRLNFMRFLPRSFRWLKDRSSSQASDDDGAGVFIFDGYHKIGQNSFPNIVPMLTGRKIELLTSAEKFQLPHNRASGLPFDSYPLIWKDFANAGYATGYVENPPEMNTFNWMAGGFREQPTDHYGRVMYMALEGYGKMRSDVVRLDESTEPRNFCHNGRRKIDILWDYAVRQFITRYSNLSVPTFMFSWDTYMAHDSTVSLKHGDGPLLETLKFLLDSGDKPWRNDTFVFLLSDHGQRLDDFRATFVGRLEDRLPFLAISVPPNFRKKFPKLTSNLKKNTKRLITALDIYATFKHILHLNNAKDLPEDVFSDVGPSGYAASLFSEISSSRTCLQAGIPEWYCSCHRFTQLNSTSQAALAAGAVLLQKINRDVAAGISAGLCANLTLDVVEYIRRVEIAPSSLKPSDGIFDEYIVQMRTKPGDGLFEATIRNYLRKKRGWKVLGTVERVNRYETHSRCLPHSLAKLRPLCFCSSSLK